MNIDIHIIDWKINYDLIRATNISSLNSNVQSKLHQDMIHEGKTLKYHAKNIPREKYKYFSKDVTKFSQLNTNSLSKWIAIVKKVILDNEERSAASNN